MAASFNSLAKYAYCPVYTLSFSNIYKDYVSYKDDIQTTMNQSITFTVIFLNLFGYCIYTTHKRYEKNDRTDFMNKDYQ